MKTIPTEGDNVSFHMAGVGRLLDEYMQATASTQYPDTMRARRCLVDIICRCARAHQLLEAIENERQPD